MGIGIRIEHLRKIYDTPAPVAARGMGFAFGPGPKKDKKKSEVLKQELEPLCAHYLLNVKQGHEPVDPVAGHIPGARNVPAQSTQTPEGRFLPAEDLRSRYAAAGVEAGKPVAVYCGSGVVATEGVFAMGLAGIDAALYAGSWSEWITNPGRPVEVGESTP